MQWNKLNEVFIKELETILGKENIIIDPNNMQDYSHDEFTFVELRHLPDIVVKPHNTQQISEIVKFANKNKIPITPRGGGTGLCGGCVPIYGGILLSLEKMNRVWEIDTKNMMAVVDAGVSLHDFYQAIEGSGLFFPPHPGDEGATIGGVIATNAGGARAVKYGVIRNFVRGIEVVLPTGEITNISGKLIKNSTGYSLLHLLIGSEGTLGIITKAIISLYPPPEHTCSLVIPFTTLHEAIQTVPAILQSKIIPLAVEFMDRTSLKITEHHLQKKWPSDDGDAHLLIMIDASQEEELLQLAEKISDICLANHALDVFIATEKAKQKNILEIRSHIYEALRNYMLEILDITVPRASIAEFVTAVHKIEQEHDTWCPTYGHAADGNVHTHIMKARWQNGTWQELPNWKDKYHIVRDKIHSLGHQFQGMISGEHGIGLIKREYMAEFLDSYQLSLMRSIKNVFDPNEILNPGKVL